MRVRLFMGDEEISQEDVKNYICISPYIADLVNEVYYRTKKAQEEAKKRQTKEDKENSDK